MTPQTTKMWKCLLPIEKRNASRGALEPSQRSKVEHFANIFI